MVGAVFHVSCQWAPDTCALERERLVYSDGGDDNDVHGYAQHCGGKRGRERGGVKKGTEARRTEKRGVWCA